MNSYRITEFDKEKNIVVVELMVAGEKRTRRFDARHLPTDSAEELNDYFINYFEALDRGTKEAAEKQDVSGVEKLLGKIQKVE